MKLVQWNPFRELESSLLGFNKSFGGNLFAPEKDGNWLPPVDIKENKNSYVINAELPGIEKDNISVDVEDHTLSISAERSSEKEKKEGDSFHTIERAYGKFYRSFSLPQNVDLSNIQADYKNGILSLVLPKHKEQRAAATKIAVR